MALRAIINWSVALTVIFLITVISATSVLAATITSANDIIEYLQVSEGANHSLTFTTPSGASEGETITVSFSSSFDTSVLTENDIDISDDSTDLTTAADCTGSEQGAVTIASDVVTIELCTGDGGAIAASSVINIEIGDNAEASGTGSNKVVNPATSGTYYISIGGTFGDSGAIAHPILTSGSSVGVTGTVTAGVDEDDVVDDTEPVETDTTAPSISSVVASGITATEATISWSTNEASTSYVDYGIDETFGTTVFEEYVYTTSHSLDLSGLDEDTVYYFQVRSIDGSGNEGTSLSYTFTTLDITAPTISDIEVIDITQDSATITWVTDEETISQLDYGLSDSYGTIESGTEYLTEHSVALTDLDDDSTYHFAITAEDDSYNIAISSDETFTTLIDEVPENVSDLVVTEYTELLVLEWSNPEDSDLAGVYGIYCTDDYPSSVTDEDCLELFDLTSGAENYTHSSLVGGDTYYYGLFAYDAAGQYASGAVTEGVPLEGTSSDDTQGDTDGDTSGETPADDDTSDTDDEDSTSGSDSTSGTSADSDDCGDGICSEDESYALCPNDCAPEVEGGTTEVDDIFQGAEMEILVADDSVGLIVTTSGIIRALADSSIHLLFLTGEEIEDSDYIMIDLDDELHLLTYSEEDGVYETRISTAEQEGEYDFSLINVGTDGSKEFRSFTFILESPGTAYETIDEQEGALTDVVFTLFYATGEMGIWSGTDYHQSNPYVSSDGMYGWYAPVGTYYVRAEKDGYEIAQTGAFRAGDSIINKDIEMFSLASAGQDEIASSDEGQIVEEVEIRVLEVLGIENEVVEDTIEIIQGFIEAPAVQEVAEISVPALAITAGASLVVMGIAFDFLPFLQYLFTAPFLLLWRRKRKGFGLVYNSLKKTPIDLATVRLYKFDTKESANDKNQRGKLVKSRVTDKFGRYFFLVPTGIYRISVTKSGFTYPSSHLSGQKEDGEFLDVYHGEAIVVSEKDALISANIPVDPIVQTEAEASKKAGIHAKMRKMQTLISLSGVVAAIIFALIRPHMSAYIMIGVQVIVYFFVRRLASPRKPSSWGIVYDKYTGRPLTNVVARIFEPKFNRLIETQVTDGKGRYSFLLGPNQYFARFEKPGFTPLEVRPIDLMQTQGANDFAINIGLDPAMSQQAPPQPTQPIQ